MNDIHQATTQKQVQDPVCKMMIDPAKAAAKIQHGDHTHYFCNAACKQKFEQDPKKYH